MAEAKRLRFIDKDRTDFFRVLRSRVNAYFTENGIERTGNWKMFLKSFVLLGSYLGAFATIIYLGETSFLYYLLWAFMGLGVAGIGMSVMHDALHGSYSKYPAVNFLMGASINLLGGSIFNWKLQHNKLHHTYTNIAEYDEDIDDKGIFRFSPHSEAKWFHRYQKYYAFLVYGITTLYWVVAKDVVQFIRYTKNGVNSQTVGQNVVVFTKMVLAKIVYIGMMIGLPLLLTPLSLGAVLLGFLVMHFVAGVVLTVIFQLAHTVEGTSHPLPNEELTIENNWAIHQLNTTVNFARKNKILSWYVGGLNYQVEHHLFPNICHVHYGDVSKIVKATCEEYDIPYLEQTTFWSALRSHVNLLHRFGYGKPKMAIA